ncbi:MAG: lipoyl(octanoyl) transferase LipB [Thermoplasmatales archaeon]
MEDLSTSNLAVDLGVVDYREALGLQRELVDLLGKNKIGDTLLILEHHSVYTVGRGKKPENYVGIEVIETERGGDVTYHGPGQVVFYPIMNLEKLGLMDVRKFVFKLENVFISSLSSFGYNASRGSEPGIWIDGKKVASIGLAIRKGISFHGIAVNVSKQVIPWFSKINPCGLNPKTIGFVEVEKEELIKSVLYSFSHEFHPFHLISSRYFKEIIMDNIHYCLTDTGKR